MVGLKMPVRLMLAAAITGVLALLAAVPAEAQSAQEAQIALRMQQLEDQVRTLTGQVEGLQFQLAQMQTLIQKMSDDYDSRLQQLEANRGGGAQPPAANPPANDQGAAAPQVETHDGVTAPVLGPNEQPMDDVGGSQDPLVGSGSEAPGVELGTLPEGSFDIDKKSDAAAAAGANSATQASAGDAEAQYAAGADAVAKGDFAFAEDQLKQFIELYPSDAKAPDATVLLGEAMIKAGDFDDAAEAMIDGYQKYRDKPQAPSILLKLGTALTGAGQRDTACRTFSEIGKRYTTLSADLKTQLSQEQAKAQCPPA
jgi:tol-pal system protein YbgF